MAGIFALGRRRVPLIEDIRIIVHKLLAGFDVVDGIDPNPSLFNHGIAVGRTGVIEEPCIVAIYGGIDDDGVVDGKQIGVMAVFGVVGIAGIRFRRCYALTGIFDEPGPGGNVMGGKSAEALDRRPSNFESSAWCE